MEKKTNEKSEKSRLRRLLQSSCIWSGNNAWDASTKRKYIVDLRNKTGAKESDLPYGLFSKKPMEIYRAIEKYDKEYKVFLEHLQENERFGKKELSFISLPAIAGNELSLLQSNDRGNVPYNHVFQDQWSVSGLDRTDKAIRVDVSKSQNKPLNLTMTEGQLKGLWPKIKAKAIEQVKADANFLKCIVALAVNSRVSVSLEFDFENEVAIISADAPGIEENGRKTSKAAFEAEKEEAIKIALRECGFKNDRIEEVFNELMAPGQNLLSKESILSGLATVNGSHTLIIETTNDYVVDQLVDELSEEVTSTRGKIQKNKLLEDVRNHFSEKGHMTGFLGAKKQYDSKLTKIKGQQLDEDGDAIQTGFKGHFFWARRAEPSEHIQPSKLVTYGGNSWMIETVYFTLRDGNLVIDSKNCSRGVQNALRKEIYSLR